MPKLILAVIVAVIAAALDVGSLIAWLICRLVTYVEQGISQTFGVPGYAAQFCWIVDVLSALGLALSFVAIVLLIKELLRPASEGAYGGVTA